MNHTWSKFSFSRKAFAKAICPLWIGLKEPPKMPMEASSSPSKGRGVPDGVKWDDGFIGGGWGLLVIDGLVVLVILERFYLL